jgi:hypothetical protein
MEKKISREWTALAMKSSDRVVLLYHITYPSIPIVSLLRNQEPNQSHGCALEGQAPGNQAREDRSWETTRLRKRTRGGEDPG